MPVADKNRNIESLAVSITEDPSVSRMTIVVGGSERVLEQISKQLNKLIEVIKIVELEEVPMAYLTEPVIRIRAKAAGPLGIV